MKSRAICLKPHSRNLWRETPRLPSPEPYYEYRDSVYRIFSYRRQLSIIKLNHPAKAGARIGVFHSFANVTILGPCGLIELPQIMLELMSRRTRGSGGHNQGDASQGPFAPPEIPPRIALRTDPPTEVPGRHRDIAVHSCIIASGLITPEN